MCVNKIFNKNKFKILIICIFPIASSCLTSEVAKKNDSQDLAKPVVVTSKLRKKAIEAAKSAEAVTDTNSIIGSSSIGEQHKNKTYFLYGAEHLKLDNYYFDIPVVYNDAVKKWLKYFLNRGRATPQLSLAQVAQFLSCAPFRQIFSLLRSTVFDIKKNCTNKENIVIGIWDEYT